MIKVDTACLESQAGQMQAIARQLDKIASSVDSVNRALRWNTSINLAVKASLSGSSLTISNLESKAIILSGVLSSAASQYAAAENRATSQKEGNDPSNVVQKVIDTILEGETREEIARIMRDVVDAILGKPVPVGIGGIVAGLISGSGGGGGSSWSKATETQKPGDRTWFGYEVDEENPGVTAWVGKTGKSEQYENGYGEVNAYLGKVEAKTKANFSFMEGKAKSELKNGEVSDSDSFEVINAELGAGASFNAVSVDSKLNAGDDMLGAGVEAKINAGNASAKGEGKFSIGEEGVNANVGGELMVSAVEAEAEGTINILGIEITAKVGGYAGAAGVEGKVGIEDNKFVCEGGVAAVLGVSGGIEIGFNEEGWDNFVDFVTFWD